MDEKTNKIEIKGIIRRGKGLFFGVFILIVAICTGIALYLPPIYSSEATIVIKNQEIPEEYVKSTITTYVNERLQMIQQQVLSRDKLMDIVKEYNLYSEVDSSEILNKMRKNIKLRTIDTAIMNERTGRATTVTIAFILSFEGSDPLTVQKVTDKLASLYVEEDRRTREQMTETTTDFFQKELENLKQDVLRHEKKISEFKAENIERLPGSTAMNLQAITRMELDRDRMDTRLQTLRRQKISLEGQIANVNPLTPVITEDGKVASNPSERLKTLRMQLIQMQASMSPKHPDIKVLKSEIDELESQVGKSEGWAEKVKLLASLEDQLGHLKTKFGPNHPDVLQLSKVIDALIMDIDKTGSNRELSAVAHQKPDNPAYMNLRTQIRVTEAEIDALYTERRKINQKLEDYRKRLEMVPLVEEEYNNLTMGYENAKHKYNEILNKLLTARMSREMDMGQSGERFTITEKAIVPDRPSKPNRVAIILFGIVLGIGVGSGLVALKEGMDHSIKSVDEIESIIGVPVIATISLFNPKEKKSRIY